MEWELKQVKETEWRQDKSRLFSYISYCPDGTVRLDIMADTGLTPVISFQGQAGDVRKCAMQWIKSARYEKTYNPGLISLEHASYIGCELARAELLKEKYVQD